MDLYHRLELSKPSKLMMKQIMLESIDEVNEKLKITDDTMQYAYQIDGTRIKSYMDIH